LAWNALRDRQREKIDRSLAIVVEATQNLNRAIFPLKSEAKNFDGSTVGLRPSEEIFCAYKSARYVALRESSGSVGTNGGNSVVSAANFAVAQCRCSPYLTPQSWRSPSLPRWSIDPHFWMM
jgi:hypothetical protein